MGSNGCTFLLLFAHFLKNERQIRRTFFLTKTMLLWSKTNFICLKFLTASKLALEAVLQTTKFFGRISVNPIMMQSPSRCEVHHNAKSIMMRSPSRCESHLDVNPILMWIPSWCEFPYDVNLIMKWISIWNKSKNDNEMNPKTPEKYSEFLIDWNVIKIETRIGILVIGKKGLFSRSCTESYFQSCLHSLKQHQFSITKNPEKIVLHPSSSGIISEKTNYF